VVLTYIDEQDLTLDQVGPPRKQWAGRCLLPERTLKPPEVVVAERWKMRRRERRLQLPEAAQSGFLLLLPDCREEEEPLLCHLSEH
jgi:hypothetical protein